MKDRLARLRRHLRCLGRLAWGRRRFVDYAICVPLNRCYRAHPN